MCYDVDTVAREISQRQLRNDSGEIMRALADGETFVVTRNGVAVGRLTPLGAREFVRRDAVQTKFERAGMIDAGRFRADVDRHAEQDPTPRA